jgi:hypothetical protein
MIHHPKLVSLVEHFYRKICSVEHAFCEVSFFLAIAAHKIRRFLFLRSKNNTGTSLSKVLSEFGELLTEISLPKRRD